MGIPADMIEKVFEPFVRAVDDAPTDGSGQGGGMGLGLAIARSFVRAHGGEVVATSAGAGQGRN